MNPQNSDPNESLEVMPPSAIMALERASIDSQVATAHAYPRSMEKFRQRALSMATLDSETADDCIYCRPVGKEKNEKGVWVPKFAEGPSIRLAEIVATNYGNLRVAARIVEQTDRFVRCEGVAHDLESNYAGKSECVESTVTKENVPYSERQRALIAKVCLAKAYRDAIFKVVPRALCKPVYEAAKKVAAGAGKTIEQRRNSVKAWLDSKKIDERRMFEALGIQGWGEVGEGQLITLTGLKTSVADGDTTLDEAFPPIVAAAQVPGATAGAITEKGKAAEAKAAAAPEATVSNTLTDAQKAELQQRKEAATAPAAANEQQQPKCKHCGEFVPDMAAHSCAQMQAAMAKEANEQIADAKASTPVGPNDSADALASIRLLLKQNEISEETFMAYCEANKINRKGQNKLDQLSTAKLLQVGKVFHHVLGEIKKFAAAK